MSTKDLKRSSSGKIKRKKLKKSSIKQTTDISTTPRKSKSKAKSKLISKPKSDVNLLNKIGKKKKQKKSTSIASSKDIKKHKKSKPKHIDRDESIRKRKKKSSKSSIPSANPLFLQSKTDDGSIAKRKKKRRKSSLKINSLKKQLMLNGTTPSSNSSSAKKIHKKSPKQRIKKAQIQVQSLKKSRIGYNRIMMAPRPSITGMYGYGPMQYKKKKTTDIKLIKIIKKKKSISSKDVHKKKKHKEIQSHGICKKKKKIITPAKTEKVRKTVKTKTRRKELYVIGDYVHIKGKKYGMIRYKGCLKHVKGIWYGVELVGIDRNGDCDGIFNEERYFTCDRVSGIFVMYEGIDRKMKREEVDVMLKLRIKGKKRYKKSEKHKVRIVRKSTKNVGDKDIKKNKQKKVKDSLKIRSRIMNEEERKTTTQSTGYICKREGKKNNGVITALPVLNVCVKSDIRSDRGRSIATRSDFNLRNIHDRRNRNLSRGRATHRNKSTDGHRRTRSLSNTHGDTSWMTHRSVDKNSSDRIKERILAQKQVDLESLMRTSSLKRKKKIGGLFKKHIEKAKVVTGKSAKTTNTTKLKERLRNEEEAMRNAVDIVKELGFLKQIKDNDIYSKIYIKRSPIGRDDDEKEVKDGTRAQTQTDFDLFDMNNIDILSKFHGKTRLILSNVICAAIVRVPGIEIVEICNADINDDFVEIFVQYLTQYYMKNKNPKITILSLQSNPISDKGMIALMKLIRMNHRVLNTLKLQNNRRDISTLICQQICESLQHNEFIIKFAFEFRHYQWRDFRDKVLKRNAEKARLERVQLQRFISV